MKSKLRCLAMLAMATVLSFSLASCGGDDEPGPGGKPSVKVTIGTVTHNAIEVTITPTNAEKVAYTCLLASETAPTANAILSSGTQVNATAASTTTISDLKDETAYVVYVAASNGDVNSRVSSTPVSTIADPNTVAPEIDLQAFVDEITSGGVTYHKYDALFYRIKIANKAKEVQIFIDELEVVQPLIDQGKLSDLFGENIKGGIPFTDEEVEICNSNAEGFFAVASQDIYPDTEFAVVVFARNSKGYDLEYKTVKIEALPTVPRVESPLFESLLGTYKATCFGLSADANQKPVESEREFTVKIIQGLDAESNEMYRSRNQLIIDGFNYDGEFKTTYPDVLMSEYSYTRNRALSKWGPKIMLEILADGTIQTLAPRSYYMINDVHFMWLNYNATNGSASALESPIQISVADNGVITIHGYRGEDGKAYYPAVVDFPASGQMGLGFLAREDITLTPVADNQPAPKVKHHATAIMPVQKYRTQQAPVRVGAEKEANLTGMVSFMK